MRSSRVWLTPLGNWLWRRLPLLTILRLSPFRNATAGWRLQTTGVVEYVVASCSWTPYDMTPHQSPMKPWQPFVLDFWKVCLTVGPLTWRWRRYANRYGRAVG